MALLDRFPRHLFSQRGWGLLAAGAVSLAAAQIMGRRDLLSLSVLLIVLPLVALAGIRLVKPRFQVYREFHPSPVETSAATTVRLAVARSGSGGGRAIMEEKLPPRFGESPAFRFPARSATGGTSRYEYHLHSTKRGQFLIGPVTAEFTDPFGLSLHRQAIDDGDLLTVTPAAVELPVTGLAGCPRQRRHHRHPDPGQPQRRRRDDPRIPPRAIRCGGSTGQPPPGMAQLMVRQEESVTTPEATIILDQRFGAFSGSSGPGFGERLPWTAMSWRAAAPLSGQWWQRCPSARTWRSGTTPCACWIPVASRLSSARPSAPEPDAEEFSGTSGLQSIAESLAAIHLSGPHHGGWELHSGREKRAARDHGGHDSGPDVFDDHLMDKLSAHRMRGPIIAVLGRISPAEARALAPGAGYGANAFAIIVSERPADSEEALEALRRGGWRAVAVQASAAVPVAWSYFDEEGAAPATAAADVRRGAEVGR